MTAHVPPGLSGRCEQPQAGEHGGDGTEPGSTRFNPFGREIAKDEEANGRADGGPRDIPHDLNNGNQARRRNRKLPR